jgi:hypothetical protein
MQKIHYTGVQSGMMGFHQFTEPEAVRVILNHSFAFNTEHLEPNIHRSRRMTCDSKVLKGRKWMERRNEREMNRKGGKSG